MPVQFEVRCPTGLRGTPPHLDLLALRVEVAVAVTVRCIEVPEPAQDQRSRRPTIGSSPPPPGSSPGVGSSIGCAASPALSPRRPGRADQVRPGAGRTFPERPTTLLYLFWEPLDADRFEEFGRHRQELAELQEAVKGPRSPSPQSRFDAMWRDWAERGVPDWLADHVDRLRARYCVSIAAGEPR